MKIIDLLNKIANGEKVPERIMYKYKIYKYDEDFQEYYVSNNEELFGTLFHKYTTLQFINDEVEINEEVEILDEEDKIEKLDQTLNRTDINDDYYRYIMENRFKINELIDEVNKLKENK